MSRNFLVTGGAGFVGSALSQKLISLGFGVTIVDDLSNGKKSNIPKGANFIQADLSEDSVYKELMKSKFSAIFHVAAQASNAISFREPVRDLLSNQLGTLRLLEFARQANIKRFLFTSSMSVYGKPINFPTDESERPFPDAPYAVHKMASEAYLRIYQQEYGLEYTVFRLYTTYGSGQNLDNLDQGLLSIYLAYLVKKIPIVVKGDLNRKRDIVHVSDVVDAMVASLDAPATVEKAFNLCTGISLTVRELLDELIKQMGYDPKTYPIDVQPPTQGDPPLTHGSYDRAQKAFGFKPKISPFDGIRMTVDELKKRSH